MLKKILLYTLGTILLLSIIGFAYYRFFIYQPPAISEMDRAAVKLMPLPSKLALKKGRFELDESFQIYFSNYTDELLARAAKRFLDRLHKSSSISFKQPLTSTSGLKINCAQGFPNSIQQAKEDESYSLKISPRGIDLDSNTPYGTLRGLETLLQMLEQDGDTFYFPALELEDQPRFPWRGIMIDVVRHWMPKEVILRNLDAMAAVKLNVLHLHLTDDQGFRVESKRFPRITPTRV